MDRAKNLKPRWLGHEDITVVPIEYFLSAGVDMTTGGECLRRLEWFLDLWANGKAVMARTGATYSAPLYRTPVSRGPVVFVRTCLRARRLGVHGGDS